jgi:hypothetical protein
MLVENFHYNPPRFSPKTRQQSGGRKENALIFRSEDENQHSSPAKKSARRSTPSNESLKQGKPDPKRKSQRPEFDSY